MAPEKLPKWFDIINPLLSDKNQGLDNIASYPEDTHFSMQQKIVIQEEDNNEDDDQEKNIEQETNQVDNEIAQGNVVDKMEEKANNIKKPFVNRTTKEGHLGLKPKRYKRRYKC